MEVKEKTPAEKFHELSFVQAHIEEVIDDAFEKYEPEIWKVLEYRISSDWYDNSIEIYFQVSLPYPYEPCKEVREAVYELGFSNVYWNFTKDVMDVVCDRFLGKAETLVKNSMDEIRNWEPRHNKHHKWKSTRYGYVDERFDEKFWLENYNFKK